jgi:hypothetical protein
MKAIPMSLASVIAGGGVTSVAVQIADHLTIDEAFLYALERWPELTPPEANQLANLAYAAYQAGQTLQAAPLSDPQPLDAVPINPFVDDGDFAGTREQIAVEITVYDENGEPGKTYLIIVPSTGLDSLSQIINTATDDLCQRARDSPGAFEDVDCDNPLIFDYEILSAVRAF